MNSLEGWYVAKQSDGHCTIVSARELVRQSKANKEQESEKWGPFASEGEAIARRVGLIRAGKCQPV